MGKDLLKYTAPESIEKAVDIYNGEENTAYLAGGTDLFHS